MHKNRKFSVLLMLLFVFSLGMTACDRMGIVECGDTMVITCGDDELVVDDQAEGDADAGDSELVLSQTIEGAGLTVHYPAAWAAQVDDDGSILIANQADILTKVGDAGEMPAAGEFGMVVVAMPLADLGGMGVDEVFEMMVSFMVNEGEDMAEVMVIQVGDGDAFRADVAPEDSTDGFILGFEAEGSLVIVVAVSAEGEIDDFESAAMAIAGAVEYSAP